MHRATLRKIQQAAPEDMAALGLTKSSVADCELLGSGANGMAWRLPVMLRDEDTGDETGAVLKWTCDPDEALVAKRAIGKKHRGLPFVFYVSELPSGTGPAKFGWKPGLKREFLIGLQAADGTGVKRLGPVFDVIEGRKSAGELKGIEGTWLDDLIAGIQLITNQKMTRDEAIYFLGEECDCHPGNIGLLDRDGRQMAVFVDLGVSPGESASPRVKIARNAQGE